MKVMEPKTKYDNLNEIFDKKISTRDELQGNSEEAKEKFINKYKNKAIFRYSIFFICKII